MAPPTIVPIIMAGGSGTRLWPLSRETMPKQFVPLIGGLSTFQAAAARVSDPAFARPIIVTNNEFRFLCGEQLAALGVEADIVLEPARRDSAPAVAVGALLARQREGGQRREEGKPGDEEPEPGTVCLLLAADHVIEDEAAFVADCRAAAEIAARGHIMTLGIWPDGPSTAYGYIQPRDEEIGPDARPIERFVEKPDRETAERYVAEGFLWNSGNFAFAAGIILEELARFAPEVLSAAEAAVEAGTSDLDFFRLGAPEFEASPAISIDYAVMERTRRGGVLSARFGWSDVGAWDALHSISTKDADGNVREGATELLDTTDSLVRSNGILTTVVGLKDVIVVAEKDAVLVAAKSAAGAVKTLVARLKEAGRPEASEHLRIHRPWGWYERIDVGERFQVKQIRVKPGGTLSLQRHFHRAEHWIVVHGTAEVTIDGEVFYRHENEAAYLPIGCIHRLHNPGRIELRLIEVQVGSYTGEDDIVRIEDVYARR